jgi:hypothetical protein
MAVTAALLAALSQAVAASAKHVAASKNAANPCAALAKEIASLDSKMRAGYSGKAGERMRDRHREAVAEFNRMRCRGL